ncbi:MAG: sigma-54-dependent Fis family transcriptional regulator [Burkholderiales bacterium]|nr:sigma-54-dependent Fis family transcriptional regulator [Burkholderiales bacterium]
MQGPFRPPLNSRGSSRAQPPGRSLAAGPGLGSLHTEQIERSHQRCQALGLSRIAAPDHARVAPPDLALLRERNLRLHLHAAPVMELLHEQITQTHSMVALTDATGTILLSIGDDDFLSRAARVALAPGANWSEAAKGTNAVGTALVSELPTLVHGDEHFLYANHFLTCSAAPILDPRGNVLGVLDVSGDQRSYHQHTMALVKLSVRLIENHWLSDDCRHGLRLHFHRRAEFIGTLMEGILAVDADGRISGANRGAQEQLGLTGAALRQHTLQSLFGTGVDALADHFRSPLAQPLAVHTADGQGFHLHARFNGPQWAPLVEAAPPAARTPATPPATAPAAPAPAARSALAPLRLGDAAMARLVDRLQRVCEHPIPVLLLGEHGCGKGVLARALHADSPRAAEPWVALNCATLPPQGAEQRLLEGLAQAAGGTLFLDEIDTLPLPLQARLLPALRQHAGGLVCASRVALAPLVRQQHFRDDLYFHLQGLVLAVPPLRERSDLPALAAYLLRQLRPQPEARLRPEALAALARHDWPGNVRELKSALRTALALAGAAADIGVEHLPDALATHGQHTGSAAMPGSESLQALELQAMHRAVADAHGNIAAAARALGVSRNTLYRRLRWNPVR